MTSHYNPSADDLELLRKIQALVEAGEWSIDWTHIRDERKRLDIQTEHLRMAISKFQIEERPTPTKLSGWARVERLPGRFGTIRVVVRLIRVDGELEAHVRSAFWVNDGYGGFTK